MPFKIKKKGSAYQVVNSDTGRVAGWHKSKGSAKEHLKALYANVPDASEKFFNPAEHRVPGGMGPGGGGGRFAPGQVTDRQQQQSARGPAAAPAAGEGSAGSLGEHSVGDRGPAEHQENQIRDAARGDLAQAHEIEQQVQMLRAQIKWDQQEIAFQSGVGPPPTTPSPGVGRTQGQAGNVGSGAVPGATSGASAQQFSNTPQPGSAATQQYIQFLRNDIASLRAQASQLEHQAAQLTDHAHGLLASIRGKTHSVPDITISAKALQELINSYNQIG